MKNGEKMPISKRVDNMEVWNTGAAIPADTTSTGVARIWGLHKLWTIICQTVVRRVSASLLDVTTALETIYIESIEALQWFKNMMPQEAAHLSG